jgi:hypothetical protein
MAKNIANIYNSTNDAISLEQKFFVKEEVTRGTLAIPTDADFLFTLGGGSVNFTQPIESSEHRSGRHNNSIIKSKTTTEFSLSTYFNIDTGAGAGPAEIDAGVRTLLKQAFGTETDTPTLKYTTADAPSTTFSLYENGDKFAKQASACFIQDLTMNFPGDGNATMEMSGVAKTAILVGIGQSVADNNGGNDITLAAGEGSRFPVGAQVMIVESDGTTRSDDTAAGTAREVTAVSGDVITLSGAALADADGSVNPVYLAYYEPEAPAGINDPQTGLEGSITIAGLTTECVRSLTLSMSNNHEVQDFCFGKEGLSDSAYVPADRFNAEVSMELNLNDDLVEFINEIKTGDFAGENIVVILGDSSSRHLKITMPKVIFPIPSIEVPDTGSIPVTFTGNAYQSALDAADEVQVEFL